MVYFIREIREGGLIKIGHTDRDIAKRINEMQTGNPAYLDLLGVMVPGTELDERRLHRQFRDARKQISGRGRKRNTLRGEWFEPTVELMELIDSLPPFPPPVNEDWEPEIVQ